MASLEFSRNQLRAFLFVMLGMDAILIGTLMGVLVSPTMGLIGFTAGVLLPFLIFRGLVPVMIGAMGWSTLQRLYPPAGAPEFNGKTPLISMSVRNRYLGINNCIETAQDEDHLHLRVFGLIGPSMMPISIPWAAMTSITVAKRGIAAVVLDQGPRIWVPEKLVAREIELREELDMRDPADEAGAP